MRVMLLGANGMLAHDILASAPSHATVHPFTKADLDITNEGEVADRITSLHPDTIINAAAYTAVDKAESDAATAFRVNAEAVGELGRVAATVGARVVSFSTDYVFDGTSSRPYTEDSPTNPINIYGASKLAGEKALHDSGAEYLILRSQWLFGLHGRSFPRTMNERAHAGLATKVVTDQTGRPTYTQDLARATWELLGQKVNGVIHIANSGEATWFDVAERVFRRAGRLPLLAACSTADYPTPARRPSYSVLATDRLPVRLRDWRAALDHFLEHVNSA